MALTFTDFPLDHAGLRRSDPDWIDEQLHDPKARAVLFSDGDLACDERGQDMILPARRTRMLPMKPPGLIFLGQLGGTPWFAGALEAGVAGKGPDFRISAINAEPDMACIYARARSLLSWHGRRKYCSNCASGMQALDGGTRLKCSECGMDHFPRVDPSVIMLPVCGDKCVMGRQASWPEGLYATIAGFIEPGETIEQACKRETEEEIHRPVTRVEYVASQPWPFPSSLMIGLICEIEDGDVIPDDDLEDARWFTRDEVRALYQGDIARWAPANFSISRLLIDRWLEGK